MVECPHLDTLRISTLDQTYVQDRCIDCHDLLRPAKETAHEAEDLLYDAWTVIANGPWLPSGRLTGPQGEWQAAAERWRDRYHQHLTKVYG